MPFTTDDVVVRSVDADRWMLWRDLTYHGDTDRWNIPAGYVTDFASVPILVSWLIPRYGVYTRAAILHDYLITFELPHETITAVDVDGVFRRVLRESGVDPVRRWVMWAGVRWGSFHHRRQGWWSTAPAVLGITLAMLPVLAISLPGVALATVIFKVTERLVP